MLWICGIFSLLAFFYFLVSALLILGVSRVKRNTEFRQERDSEKPPFVSILVAARNEERFIATCLESLVQQQYPSDRFEIVIVNDRSTDRTPTIINRYRENHGLIKSIDLHTNLSDLTGKQNALKEGLKLCSGEIILNTDADCIAGPLWIARTASRFAPDIGLTMGFSTTTHIDDSGAFFGNLQSLDMLFLMDAAAGSIGMNVPVSCLGRNLAYRKALIDDVGYLGSEYTITEDAALIQAVAKSRKWRIAVVYDSEASVLTFAEESVKQFLSQRTRWLLGGQSTRTWTQIPLHAMFLFNACFVMSLPLMFFTRYCIPAILVCIFVKTSMDFIRCWRVCREFGRTDLLKLFIPYQGFMVSYSIIIGFGSIFVRKVRWKGDVYKKNGHQKHGTQ